MINFLRFTVLGQNCFAIQARTLSLQANKHLCTEEGLTRVLKVAIIGAPNAGKSTLINNVMDRCVCPVSSKVHTTRKKSEAIFTEANAQIIFVDTPGLVNDRERKKFNLEDSFISDSIKSIKKSDIIGVIHDASNNYTRETLDIKIIKLLTKFQDKPSFLVLNKVDKLKSKRKLLDLIRILSDNQLDGKPIPGPEFKKESNHAGWPFFKEFFMVSALTGDGLQDLRQYLTENAKPGEWPYPPETYSDQTIEEIIEKTVKATLLDFLPQEIPYQLTPEIEYLSQNPKGGLTVSVLIHCPDNRRAQLVAGCSNGKLRQITESVQQKIQNVIQNFVRLKLVLQSPDSKN